MPKNIWGLNARIYGKGKILDDEIPSLTQLEKLWNHHKQNQEKRIETLIKSRKFPYPDRQGK